MIRQGRASHPRLLAAMRKEEAFKLKLAGKTYRQIGAEIGVSHTHAMRMVIDTLEETRARTATDVERLRELEARRMESIIESLWEMRADSEVAGAIVRASARRAKLYGLDAPVKIQETPADMGPALHLENLTLEELEAYERLVAKAASVPMEIDVTPERLALPQQASVPDEGAPETKDEEPNPQ